MVVFEYYVVYNNSIVNSFILLKFFTGVISLKISG